MGDYSDWLGWSVELEHSGAGVLFALPPQYNHLTEEAARWCLCNLVVVALSEGGHLGYWAPRKWLDACPEIRFFQWDTDVGGDGRPAVVARGIGVAAFIGDPETCCALALAAINGMKDNGPCRPVIGADGGKYTRFIPAGEGGTA